MDNCLQGVPVTPRKKSRKISNLKKVADFIAIDFETATFVPNSAVSIGLVKFRNYKPVDSYYSLIRPPRLYIRPDFTAIHGLTVDDVRDTPNFKHIWENDIESFIGEIPLAAHNAAFDMNVLKATLAHYNLPLPKNKYFCSLSLSRRVLTSLRKHSLPALAREFHIEYKAHNALADAEVCGQIIELCAGVITEQGGRKRYYSLDELLKRAGVKVKEM
jgi:DNA polymerase-3 subunit epsilon